MINPKKVLYVGSFGFPYGSAIVYRMLQIATILNNIGYKTLVINRRGLHNKEYSIREGIKVYGKFKDISYIHTSLNAYRPNNYIVRNIFKAFGFVIEFLTIIYQRIFCNCKLMVCNSTDLTSLRYYFYLSRLFRLKFASKITRNEKLKKKLEVLYDLLNTDNKLIAQRLFQSYFKNSKNANKRLFKKDYQCLTTSFDNDFICFKDDLSIAQAI